MEKHELLRQQFENLVSALSLAKSQLLSLKRQTDVVEQCGNLSEMERHHEEIAHKERYVELLHDRQSKVHTLAAEALEKHKATVQEKLDCDGCRHLSGRLLAGRNEPLCIFGWEMKRPSVLVHDILKCPDPHGKDLDGELPRIYHAPQEKPRYGAGFDEKGNLK